MSTTKKIVTLALFMAIHVIFNTFYIPVTDSLRITFSFLIMMPISAIFDFKTAVLYGLIEDLVAFIVYPSGSFFIGYTLAAGLSMAIYSFFLYKKVTIKNIIFARTSVSIINNILLNSIFNTILLSKGFTYYILLSIPKNLILLPLEIILFIIVWRSLEPLFIKAGLIKKSS